MHNIRFSIYLTVKIHETVEQRLSAFHVHELLLIRSAKFLDFFFSSIFFFTNFVCRNGNEMYLLL